jgi:hypothetical protein
MTYVLILLIVLAAVYGLVKVASGDRYAKMTEEEFEAEAKRGSRIGAGILAAQKIIDPEHRVEYIQQADKHAEADAADSGDRPETGSTSLEKN